MRKHGEWMTQVDERILEYLSENGNHQPHAIADNLREIGVDLDYHSNSINRRCRELRDYRLIINVGGGVYSTTDLGEQFLAGDLDAGTLEKDE
ncbi:MarR family transcriptional regulator [Natrinema sp. DC36]|uniref:MarR family transcriptional regulator n=1 Tax=Natrinema sp. DC36 TaxID=2878680 RepID=UPI001CF007F0|nr:MarR family transcriptional regulator [Natrinema sp. DC36]